MAVLNHYTVGDIVYENPYGPYKITKDLGVTNHRRLVEVLFLEPNKFGIENVTCVASLSNINAGSGVANPYFPKLCGVGCKGRVDNKTPEYEKCRAVWEHIISFCYNPKATNYKYYGGIGITVCLRWHCLEFFMEDIKYLPNYNEWLNTTKEYVFDIDKSSSIIDSTSCKFMPISYNKNKNVVGSNKEINKYTGIRTKPSGSIEVNIKKKMVGTFYDENIAACYYNYLGRLMGYDESMLNTVPPEYQNITISNIRNNRIPQKKKRDRYSIYTILNDRPDYDAKFLKMIEDKYMD